MNPVTSKANGWQLAAGRDSEELKMETDGGRRGGRLVFSLLYTIRPSPNCQECSVTPPLPPPNSISDEILTVIVCVRILADGFFIILLYFFFR